MAFKKFYVSTPDVDSSTQLQRIINTIQQNVEDEFSNINKTTLLNYIIKDNININTTATIPHGLGRPPLGYIIIKKNSNANVWDSLIDNTNIVLNSSANTTVSIYIF